MLLQAARSFVLVHVMVQAIQEIMVKAMQETMVD